MKILKTDVLLGGSVGSDFSVSGGGTLEDPNNILNPDFSYSLGLQGATISLNIPARVANEPSNSLVLHGLRASSNNIRVEVFDNGSSLGSNIIRSGSSFFITRSSLTNTKWDIQFTNADNPGASFVVYISNMRAGAYSEVPRGGERGGEYFPSLGNNRRSQSTSNQMAQPVTRNIAEEARSVNLNINDAPSAWVNTDLQDIFALYNRSGLVSVLMFDESDPSYAFCGFDLIDRVSIHGSTRQLLNVSLTMRSAK